MSLRRCALVGIVLLLAFEVASAVQPINERDPREFWPATPDERSTTSRPAGGAKSAAAAVGLADFLDTVGGEWDTRFDPRTGRFTMVQGSGVALLPGRGNALDPAGLVALRDADGALSVERVEPLARAFVERRATMIAPGRGELVLDTTASAIRDDGRLISVYYDWIVDGVPVEGAAVFVRVNSGNVTQFGSRFVGPIDAPTVPALAARQAVSALLEYTGDAETARLSDQPRLLLQPEAAPDGIDYRLVWSVPYRVEGRIEGWEGRVDATTGAVVGFHDTNAYGRVAGGIHRTSPLDAEIRVPFRDLAVTAGGAPRTTDDGGGFRHTGGAAETRLDGKYFDVACQGCTNPASPFVNKVVGHGFLDLGVGGVDEIGSGASTLAGRTSYYWLNAARRVAQKWIPGTSWIDTQTITAVVNRPQTCNAFYDGNVNFFRSGGGCNNTGEIADVIVHEWGHGLDLNTNPGDGGTGEGTADLVAMQLSHSALIGPGFRDNGAPVRNVDVATSPRGLLTRSGIFAGDCDIAGITQEVHCVGEVLGQAVWELSNALAAEHGHHTGWRTAERLFFTSLADQGSWDPAAPLSVYDAYVNADDDDGNLANGTPNGALIYAAFEQHEIAGAVVPTSPAVCSPPETPTVVATGSCGTIELSWNPIGGVEHYELLRADLVEDTAYLPLATLPAGTTSYVDDEVAPGVDYFYSVMAVDASGCESAVESTVYATLPDQPILEIVDFDWDDLPRGNRSGFPDPGEEVDLILTMKNHGAVAGSSVEGQLVSSTPFVEVLEGQGVFADLGAGQTETNQTTLRVRTPPGITCGAVMQFRFTPDEATGCAEEVSYFTAFLGERIGNDFLCDPTPACFVEPTFDGVAAATPGESCGETVVSWPSAESNCQNAAITYNVYRGFDPTFAPGPATLVASGLTGNQYVDALLEPGQPVWYVVRAFDSRSGEESNEIMATAMPPAGPDVRAPQFDGVATSVPGGSCGETVLSWQPAVETCTGPVFYDVYRSADPGFTPGPATLVASTTEASLVDVAVTPGVEVTYVVRARDNAGNAEHNDVRTTLRPFAEDLLFVQSSFESNAGGWSTGAPNDATAGNWEWGDPVGTGYQPEDDATPLGTRCWITGVGPTPSNGDVDDGQTTLYTASYDVTGAVEPAVRYSRWFTNDRGAAPGELTDRLIVSVSDDAGATWRSVEVVGSGTPLEWVPVEIPLAGLVDTTLPLQFRFRAADQGAGSLVEAGIDDFSLIGIDQGCVGCSGPVQPIRQIEVNRFGEDVVIDWTADPGSGARFVVHTLEGAAFDRPVTIGSTTERSYVHVGAIPAGQPFFYRVGAIDACGNASPLE